MVNKIKSSYKIKTCIIFVAAILIRLLNPTTPAFTASVYEYISAITLILLWLYGTNKKIFTSRKYTNFELLGFGLFSLFSTLSYIYGKEISLHDINLYMGTYCVFSFVVNFNLAKYGKQIIEYLITHKKSKPIKNKFLAKQISSNNFLFYFMFLFAIYLVVLVVNYPGVLMYDPMIQIMQIFNIPNAVTSQANLIDPEQFITTHHPFIHTMLIKLFLYIGDLLGSLDVGMFLYALLQITIMALAIARLLVYVHKYFSNRGILAWLFIFSLNPIVLMYTGLMVKDTLFAVLFMLFGIKFYEYIKENTVMQNKKWTASFLVITILCSFFRNNFFYAAFLTFLTLLIRKKDKTLFKTFAIYLCIYFMYTSVLIPGLGVSSGSIREAISVPFQQTANYAKYYDVTEEEKEAISNILDFETTKLYQHPEVSDLIKNTYNKNATTEDLVNYFTTWVKMFFKHPLAYFDAYFNQFYGYFSTRPYFSASYYLEPNLAARQKLIETGVSLTETVPFLAVKQTFSIGLIILSVIPGLYLINNSGIYIWIIITGITILQKSRKKNLIWFYLPYILYFATLLLSPANASIEYRYMFPYLIALPILIAPIREINQTKQNIDQNNGASPLLVL